MQKKLLLHQENLYSLNPFANIAATNEKARENMMKFIKGAIEVLLTARQRQIMEMYYLEGKRVTDISIELNINKASVSRHIKASMRKIRKVSEVFEVLYKS